MSDIFTKDLSRFDIAEESFIAFKKMNEQQRKETIQNADMHQLSSMVVAFIRILRHSKHMYPEIDEETFLHLVELYTQREKDEAHIRRGKPRKNKP